MTKPLAFTQASLRRAIVAAQKEGLRVTGIRPDGTILVNDGDNEDSEIAAPRGEQSKWASAKQ